MINLDDNTKSLQRMSEIRTAILDTVNNRHGVNGVDLVLNVMGIIGPSQLDNTEYVYTLTNLVETGEIVELEFILPVMDYRVKSIYFPKGTKLLVNYDDYRANRPDETKQESTNSTNAEGISDGR
jgi:hypothetical protein